jgi:hypothetical protein
MLVAENGMHLYLCDFGLAKLTSSRGATQTGSFLGTVDYCAPEQIQGEPLDGRADIYSLGCVLYHCLSGQAPYERETDFAVLQAHLSAPPPALSSARPDLPRSLDEVIVKALAKSPDDRYSTSQSLAEAFRTALVGSEEDATRAVPVSATKPQKRQVAPRGRPLWGRRRLIAAAVVVVALAAGAAGVLATRGSDDRASNAAELRPFVDRIENVLLQSAAGRGEIAAALSDGFNCSIPPREAGRRIASVADNRQSILQQLGSLRTPTAEADNVVTLLQQALQDSIEADRHYRDGFFAVAEPKTHCPLPRNANFTLAGKSDARATAAKERFVAAFDPLAERFQRRTWSAGQI